MFLILLNLVIKQLKGCNFPVFANSLRRFANSLRRFANLNNGYYLHSNMRTQIYNFYKIKRLTNQNMKHWPICLIFWLGNSVETLECSKLCFKFLSWVKVDIYWETLVSRESWVPNLVYLYLVGISHCKFITHESLDRLASDFYWLFSKFLNWEYVDFNAGKV